MAKYTRVSRQEFPSIDPNRQGKTDVAYVYMDERFQTLLIQLKQEDDTPERVKEELLAAAQAAAGAGPETLEIE